MVGIIMVVSALTYRSLLHSMCDLKALQMKMLIWELILYEFELAPNIAEVTKNIYCAKVEGKVDYCIVTKWF